MLGTHVLPSLAPPAAHAVRTRAPESPLQRCLAASLDEVDYGVLMVDAEQQVQHVNHAARAQLGEGRALQVEQGRLIARGADAARALAKAVRDAVDGGRRCMLRLSAGDQTVVASVAPLPDARVLIVLPRPQPVGRLALQWFARQHGLTPAEEQVLRTLAEGAQPAEVAERHGVALSTVRSQIGGIRHKTGAANIGALLRQMAALPPSVCALREVAAYTT